MFKKLQRKILLLNMSLISFVMLLAFAVIYLITWQDVQQENLRRVSREAPTKVESLEADGVKGESGALVSHAVSSDSSRAFSLILNEKDHSIREIGSIMDMSQEAYGELARLALSQSKKNGVITLDNKNWMYHTDNASLIQIQNGMQTVIPDGIYIFFLDITESQQQMRSLLMTLLAVGIGVLFTFYWISLFFSKRAVKPLVEAWEKQKQFIADASHELKTPLSIINANCGVLLESPQETVESQSKWIHYMQAGSDRMASLVTQLLILAKADGLVKEAAPVRVDMSRLARDTVQFLEAVAQKRSLHFIYHIEPDIKVNGCSERLGTVLTILVENAIKYADKNIEISLTKNKRRVYFSVKNDGEGISAAELPKVFDRFYRNDPARTGSNGYGLGLSIAKSMTESLNGKINAESKPNEYTSFVLSLPNHFN